MEQDKLNSMVMLSIECENPRNVNNVSFFSKKGRSKLMHPLKETTMHVPLTFLSGYCFSHLCIFVVVSKLFQSEHDKISRKTLVMKTQYLLALQEVLNQGKVDLVVDT